LKKRILERQFPADMTFAILRGEKAKIQDDLEK
jgi:hypothetical protein